MKKIGLLFLPAVILSACSKPDPILPGLREQIFKNNDIVVLNKNITDLPENITQPVVSDCPYTQDSSNIVWKDNKKIFSGFPETNFIKTEKKPVCNGDFVYAGLTTGELIKINSKTKNIAWIADIYKQSNMTGGSTILDITAPIIVQNDSVYVGGLGDAFCKLSNATGSKKWCVDIGVQAQFIIVNQVAFVVSTDSNLYAINTDDGSVYWRAAVKKQVAPKYENKTVIIKHQTFNAETGNLID